MSNEEPQDQSADEDAAGQVPVDPRVEAALRRAADLAAAPPSEHVLIYEDVHRTLQEVLADAAGTADASPGGASPGGGDAAR